VIAAPLRPLDDPYLARYLARAPLALALERAHECELYRGRALARPVLDVGCGDGLFAEVLFGPGAGICYGVDPDRDELRAARSRQVYRTLLQARGDAIPLRDGACGTVFSNSVLEHIPPLDATLQEIRRVLRRGGELLVTVPTDRYERYCTHADLVEAVGLPRTAAALRRRFNRFWRHHHALPVAGWRARVVGAGFEVVETVEYAPAAVCRLLAVATPAALPAFVARRTLGRWTFAPAVRTRLAPWLARAFAPALRLGCPEGGLLFVRARAA
jgi:SAM-dependent methyltransferase